MDLKGFLKENNGFPENRRVHISPCFRENGEEVLWELRAVSEEEYRRAAEGKRDKWAVLCMLSVVVPDLTDRHSGKAMARTAEKQHCRRCFIRGSICGYWRR